MKEEIYFVSPITPIRPFQIHIAGVSYCDGSYRIMRLNSAVLCMEYILDGCGTVECDGKTVYPCRDDIYLLRPGCDHFYFSDAKTPWNKIWFNAAGPLIDALLEAYGLSDTILFEHTGMGAYFQRMVALCRSEAAPDTVNAGCALVFHELLQALYEKKQGGRVVRSPEALVMKNYLDSHLNENVSAEQLAALIYKSRSQAIRIFKQAFDTTPYDYLLERRLEQAKALLKNTRLLVKEIAFRTGFSDEHYFSDLFKRKCGIPPKEYRMTADTIGK